MIDKNKLIIDSGNEIDWGRTSKDYQKHRKGYPEVFYYLLRTLNIGQKNQKVLDLATGTGEIAINLAKSGAEVIGLDNSQNQIAVARRKAKDLGLSIEFKLMTAEDVDFNDNEFDVITASCSWNYFDKEICIPKFKRILKPDGKLLICYLIWLPEEDKVARASERLVLLYNPNWTGAGFKGKPEILTDIGDKDFELTLFYRFRVNIEYTKDDWCGRIRACRGVGAFMDHDTINEFDNKHRILLDEIEQNEVMEIKHMVWFYIFENMKST